MKPRYFNIITGCSLVGLFISCHRTEEGPKPNIIFIMADDLGYNDLGCYGQQEILTPNIDQLAKEGIKFTQCYAGSTVCAPSRSVLMTGLHTGHTTVRGNSAKANAEGMFQGRVPLEDKDFTIAELLRKAGYVTGITGKWGLGEPGTSGVPNKQGFDEWMGFLNQRHAHDYYPEYLWKNEEKIVYEENLDGGEKVYAHDVFTQFAIDFIEKQKDTSFFLYLPYTIPHAKYQIPDTAPYSDKDWEPNEKVHAAMITRMDRDVGKILDLLKINQLDDHTIVFFCSDNGAADMYDSRFHSSGELRGHKRDLYEGGIRVPMIVRWKGKTRMGIENGFPWYFTDIMATFADIAGIDLNRQTDGISVLPLIMGEEFNPAERFLYWEFFEGGFSQAARWKEWKAVKNAGDSTLELYNLMQDIKEENDVAASNPDMVDMFEHYMDTARTETPYWPVNQTN